MKEQKIVITDFDGTIIDGDLELMFLRWLLKNSNVRFRVLFVSILTLPINIIRNYCNYPSVYKSWTFVLKNNVDFYIKEFIETQFNNIRLKSAVVEDIYNIKASKNVLLTGCYQKLVERYISKANLKIKFNEIIGTTVDDDFISVRRHPYGKGKIQYVNQDNYNIGFANEKRDSFYMNLCDEQYYV